MENRRYSPAEKHEHNIEGDFIMISSPDHFESLSPEHHLANTFMAMNDEAESYSNASVSPQSFSPISTPPRSEPSPSILAELPFAVISEHKENSPSCSSKISDVWSQQAIDSASEPDVINEDEAIYAELRLLKQELNENKQQLEMALQEVDKVKKNYAVLLKENKDIKAFLQTTLDDVKAIETNYINNQLLNVDRFFSKSNNKCGNFFSSCFDALRKKNKNNNVSVSSNSPARLCR